MVDSQNSDSQDVDVPNNEATSDITPEQQAEIDRIKRRNLIIAAIFGIILMILGFLAGQYKKQNKEDSLPEFSTSVAVCEIKNQSAVCL